MLALLGGAMLSFSACDDLLDTEPRQSVSSEVALTDITGVRAVLNSVYDRLQVNTYYGAQMMLAPDVMADNLRQTTPNSNRYTFFQNNTQGLAIWGTAYAAINEVNFVIKGIETATTTEAEKSQIRGEAHFLRALLYFDLARIYGYEPGKEVSGWNLSAVLRLTPTASLADADMRERSTNVAVYTQIESDLGVAIKNLVAPSTSAAHFRGNKAAAEALMSRVSLYQGKWQQALDNAKAALATKGFTTAAGGGVTATSVGTSGLTSKANYVNAFKTQPNPESLFELRYIQATESLGSNESLHSLTSTFTTGAWGDIVPTAELYNLYEAGDVRKNMYYSPATPPAGVPSTPKETGLVYSQKYSATGGAFTDNIPLFRTSELYLIKAEAEAELNNLTDALLDLNALRLRSGASVIVETDKGTIIDKILVERRLELAFEGHRFFDLKRRGLPIDKQDPTPSLDYSNFRVLSAIPADQVTLNPKIKQNPGY
ncbi:RagB/SusD family nutrient uptake outer membrane protein [Rufibacter sp. DG15C]|uniref:RagB/SusD family nutrient uptake outer membrane protein n=1 Tax=Rufibacter sp. DG15C TaxID=1379909 RepID=UPI000ABE13BB|nr:RagB/SusD family nutrient uptake outer membrane protein [Rufibacter sp. DG15C]